MKKFNFPLDRVLNYKAQVEDSLKSEHAQIIKNISDREKEKEMLEGQFAETAKRMEEETGSCKISSFLVYDNFFHGLANQVKHKEQEIDSLRYKEERKRQEVVHARMETASIEKLKERKQQEYQKEVQKDEERMVEEFVSNQNSSARMI